MNENKVATVLNRIFHIIFLVSFGIIFASILFIGYIDNDKGYTLGTKLSIISGLIILTAIFSGIYILLQKDKNNDLRHKNKFEFNDKNTKIIIFSAIGVLLIIQLVVGYLLKMNPVTDMNYVNKYALDFAQSGNFDLIQEDCAKKSVYLIRYPNNYAITFLLSILYRISYLIFGYVPRYVPVVMNVFAINISVLLTVFIAKRLFGNKKSLFVLLLCVLFAPYYTYTSYYYTDSLSMPFTVLAIYLFICALQSDKKIKKYVMMTFCGVSVFIGFKIKGSVIIIIAVSLVYLILKLNFKKAICFILALISGFGVVSAAYSVSFNSMNIETKQQADAYEYPYTHWIMMGLKNVGHYNLADSQFTQSFPTKKEKQDANIEEIKHRLNEYGADGFAVHCIQKAVWTWEDGTYFISHHIEKPVRKNFLHSFILESGEYYWIFFAYSCGFQLFLMLMILMSLYKGLKNTEINFLVLLKGIVFAAFLFFLAWETRSRYLYNLTPTFILLSVDGLDYFTLRIKNLLAKNK